MVHQIPIDSSLVIPDDPHTLSTGVADDVFYQRVAFVNVVFLGISNGWVLVDAGLSGSAGRIRSAARERFGDTIPSAIFLTHGHFDHVGAIEELTEWWDVPIFAHVDEIPFLSGKAAYPPADPSLMDGLMSALSGFFPKNPIDVSHRLIPFPEDGTLPILTGWKWLATPGHSMGHVSFWRTGDNVLISGDAVITTAQESAYAALTQTAELHGPPRYFTPDWVSAEQSALLIADLHPHILVPGHGKALQGVSLQQGLQTLAGRFKEVAVPSSGRWVVDPADRPLVKVGDM